MCQMKWVRGHVIGHGSSATVSLGRNLPRGDIFAVKFNELSKSHSLQKEQEIHSNLCHDQIIEYKGCEISIENGHSFYNMFVEYAPFGTLIDAIQIKGGALGEHQIRQYTRDILKGLRYLHSKGIVHCDIKCANVLVTSQGVKIGDFGCSRLVADVAGCHSSGMEIAGTPMYMAPEVARGEQQSYPADVWALGCTVLEMVTGHAPWPNIANDPFSALYWIGLSGQLPEIPIFVSDQAKDFLSKCFNIEPSERWSVCELLKHPFVDDVGIAKIDFKELHGPSFNSPTSVLGQGVWESIEKLDPAQDDPSPAHERPNMSPSEKLIGMSSWAHEVPDWTNDEDWITARSYANENQVLNGPGLVFRHIELDMVMMGLEFGPIEPHSTSNDEVRNCGNCCISKNYDVDEDLRLSKCCSLLLQDSFVHLEIVSIWLMVIPCNVSICAILILLLILNHFFGFSYAFLFVIHFLGKFT